MVESKERTTRTLSKHTTLASHYIHHARWDKTWAEVQA